MTNAERAAPQRVGHSCFVIRHWLVILVSGFAQWISLDTLVRLDMFSPSRWRKFLRPAGVYLQGQQTPMTQWTKHPGCRLGVHRRADRRASVVVAGCFALPRSTKDRGEIRPAGPPGWV